MPVQHGALAGILLLGGIDELFLQQATERDVARRELPLHRIQQLTIDRVMYAPIMDLRGLIGIGPRVADHTINAMPMYAFPSYEDMRLKNPWSTGRRANAGRGSVSPLR